MTGKNRRGYTLMELLTVVAVLALTASIAIPAVLGIRNSLTLRQRDEYARAVFLAAQSRLLRMQTEGATEALADCPQAQLGEGYRYADAGTLALLVADAGESIPGSAQIILEFHPETGHVAAVFYYEGARDIRALYTAGSLPREEDRRRELLLGYCDGSGLDRRSLGCYCIRAELTFENGQAATVRVTVPTQVSENGVLTDLTSDGLDRFREALSVTLTLTGERGGSHEICLTGAQFAPGSTSGGVNALVADCVLDSLTRGGTLGDISAGDNISVVARVRCGPCPDGTPVLVRGAALAGVNPMFGSLTQDAGGGLLLRVSNGRHLQNLSRLSAQIAEQLSAVLLTGADGATGKGAGICIDWQETSEYYQGLDFVPIANEALLGSLTDPADRVRPDILGNGAVIRGLRMEGEGEYLGLFAAVNTRVEGLILDSPRIIGAEASTVGALAGLVGPNGQLTGCGCYDTQAAGGISGAVAGGLAGRLEGTMTRCYGAVPVSGRVSGGLAGQAEAGSLTQCYAAGAVRGDTAGGLVGTAADCAFCHCFATGGVWGDISGGFAGTLGGDSQLVGCYSLGLCNRDGQEYEGFCAESTTELSGNGDYYRALALSLLETGEAPADYRFRDCWYLVGNCPEAAYGTDVSGDWAAELDYAGLSDPAAFGETLLARLKQTPLDSPAALTEAKTRLLALGVPAELLEGYQDCGSYGIFFDAGDHLLGAGELDRRYLECYAAAFASNIWDKESEAFPTLLALPWLGEFPARSELGDFGVVYYERRTEGLTCRRMSLSSGQETATAGSGEVTQWGYALYLREGTLPFAADTWALAGETVPDLGLPEGYTARALPAEGGVLQICSRYFGNRLSLVTWFADTLDAEDGPYRIRCQDQLENIARMPEGAFLLEGRVTLTESYTPIPELGGSLTGAAESGVYFSGCTGGLVDTLRGSMEGIRATGSLRLSGTAGALAARIAGGTLRDCRVAVQITASDAGAVGAVAGVLESGTVRGTWASLTETGEGLGGFLGEALGGRVVSCRSDQLPFAASAAVTEARSLPDATHTGSELLTQSVTDGAGLTALSGQALCRSYATEFTDCTAGGGDIFETAYYYRLTDLGGWKQRQWTGYTQTALTADALAGLGTDWTRTDCFLEMQDSYLPLLGKQNGEGWLFGYEADGAITQSQPVIFGDEELTRIPFDTGEYGIFAQEALPESGTFLLVTDEGEYMYAVDGIPGWVTGTFRETCFWQAGAEHWSNGGAGVSVEWSADSRRLTVYWQEQVSATVQTDAGQETVSRTYSRSMSCTLYQVWENTEKSVVYLGMDRVLRQGEVSDDGT